MKIPWRVQRANTQLLLVGLGCIALAITGAGLSIGGVSAKNLTATSAIALGVIGALLVIASLIVGVEPPVSETHPASDPSSAAPPSRMAFESEPILGPSLQQPASAAFETPVVGPPFVKDPGPTRAPENLAEDTPPTTDDTSRSRESDGQARLLRSEIAEAQNRSQRALDEGEWPVRFTAMWRDMWPDRSRILADTLQTEQFEIVAKAAGPLRELQKSFAYDRRYERALSDSDEVFLHRVIPVLRAATAQLDEYLAPFDEESTGGRPGLESVREARRLRAEVGEAISHGEQSLADHAWPVPFNAHWREAWVERNRPLAEAMTTDTFERVARAHSALGDLQNAFSYERQDRVLISMDEDFLQEVIPILRAAERALGDLLSSAGPPRNAG